MSATINGFLFTQVVGRYFPGDSVEGIISEKRLWSAVLLMTLKDCQDQRVKAEFAKKKLQSTDLKKIGEKVFNAGAKARQQMLFLRCFVKSVWCGQICEMAGMTHKNFTEKALAILDGREKLDDTAAKRVCLEPKKRKNH